jgi:radical SAM protein with 4Fe4S-binding SPASM domain
MSRPFNLNEIDRFKAIELEIFHGCNRNCTTCPRSVLPTNNEMMADEIYFKVMEDLKKADYRGRISPYDMGEPTLNPKLHFYISETRKLFPNNIIFIGSNGIAIDQDYVRSLFVAGLNQILITCYDEFVWDKFKSMEDNITVRLLKVFDQDLNKIFMNRGGNIEVGENVKVQRPCSKGLHQAMINYLGDMVLCCSDYQYEEIAGNVMETNTIELWNCEKFKSIREFLAEGQRDKISLCSRCNYGRQPEDLI